MKRWLAILLTSLWLADPCPAAPPSPAQIDAEVRRRLESTGVKGLALALIADGQVHHLQAYGQRNAQGQPLQTDTVMYGASLTKAVFAYTVMQMAEDGLLDLDAPLARYLPQPLPAMPRDPKFARWSDLAGDERWRLLTARILLSHRGGFANFAWAEPDGRLRLHFTPGSRYAYSGEGYHLLQFVLEKGLGLDVGAEMQRRVFDRFDMQQTGMSWRPGFAANVADGFTQDGRVVPHEKRGRPRTAGSMDTSIKDFARFAAGFMRGEGLSPAGRAELVRAQAPISSRRQFPTLDPGLQTERPRPDLAAGLGVIVFNGPQGPAFFKGGHDDSTANTWVCVEEGRRCLVLLAHDVRAEALFPALVGFVLGETGAPWDWEYGTAAN